MALNDTDLYNEILAEIAKTKIATPISNKVNDKGILETTTESKPDMGMDNVIKSIAAAVTKHIQDNLELAASLTFLPAANPTAYIDTFSVTSAPLTGVGGGVPGPVSIPVVSISSLTGSMTVTVPKGKFS